ncbi:MAG: hypothetical protein BJ554DRAFT_5549, partial [Olpidium bornovanus]
LLKQPQYNPLPVEQQVCIIFAGVNGFLDKIPVARVVAFEKAFLPYLAIEHKGLLEKIRTTGPAVRKPTDGCDRACPEAPIGSFRGATTSRTRCGPRGNLIPDGVVAVDPMPVMHPTFRVSFCAASEENIQSRGKKQARRCPFCEEKRVVVAFFR